MPQLFHRALKPLLCAILLAAFALHGSPARADDNPYDGKLNFTLTPYIWLPTVNGTFRYDVSDLHENLPNPPAGTIQTQIGPNNYLTKLNFAFMGAATIRQGNLALYTDYITLGAGNQSGSSFTLVGPLGNPHTFSGSVTSHLNATLWTVGPSYTVFNKQGTTVDVLVGARFAWMKASFDYNVMGSDGILNANGSASKSGTLSDVLVGTYGKIGLGNHWSIPFYWDLGTGTPAFTTEVVGGIKYGQLSLLWRYLDYSNAKSSNLVQSADFGGPMLGYTFRF